MTGTIGVVIERRKTGGASLYVGLNHVNVETAGTTVYESFRAPKTGYYRFLCAPQYQEDGAKAIDAYATLADSEMNVFSVDGNGGYRLFHMPGSGVLLKGGTTYYLGTRFADPSETSLIPVLIEEMRSGKNYLTVGANSFTIDVANSVLYRPFKPTESGRYTFYSTGSSDTFGTFADANTLIVHFYDDDSGDGRNFRFSAELTAGTTYQIGARYFGSTETGTINVVVEKEQTFDGTIEWNANDLQNGTLYYVRVRSYHVFEGMTYFGQWSNVLSVRPGSGQTVNDRPNRALLIGEMDYGTTSPSLYGGANNANTMAGILKGLANGFETTVRLDRTKSEILGDIRSAYPNTTSSSVSVFYFSGHGDERTGRHRREDAGMVGACGGTQQAEGPRDRHSCLLPQRRVDQ